MPVPDGNHPLMLQGRPFIRAIAGVQQMVESRKIRKEPVQALCRAQEELRRTQERVESILATCPATTYTCEVGGKWAATFISENVRNQFAYEPNQFLEDHNFWVEHIHPDDRERVLAGLSCLLEDDFHVFEYRFLHKDGSYRWVHDKSRLIRDEQGKPLECVGAWTDITDSRKAENKLRESEEEFCLAMEIEERFCLAMEITNDALWDWNIVTNEVRRNARHTTMLGYEPHELSGSQDAWEKLVHPDDRQLIREATDELLAGKRDSFEIEYRLRTKSGDYIWVLGRGKVITPRNRIPLDSFSITSFLMCELPPKESVTLVLEGS
ncbi:MAG: PAS domain-containing protein [Phycisphaerae bacterium]|nr:PAS domain-containing protein [Phycisphaerae bacterium]